MTAVPSDLVAEENRRYGPLLRALRGELDELGPHWLERDDPRVVTAQGSRYLRIGPERGLVGLPPGLDTEAWDARLAVVCARFGFQEPDPLRGGRDGNLHAGAVDARGARLGLFLGDTLDIWVDCRV